MRKDLLEIVCCPEDRANLTIEGAKEDDHGDIVTGILRCTKCGFAYPIEDGIPNLLPPAYHMAPKKAAKKAAKKAVKKAAKKSAN